MRKLALLLVQFIFCHCVAAQGYTIGTYYYPGWKDNQLGGAYPEPWEKIKPYPEREPLLGWYPEGDQAVMKQQLSWMKQHGLEFVVFNWYWSRDSEPMLAHALLAYLELPQTHQMRFALSWANHTDYTFSRKQFVNMFRYWAESYMSRSDYLRLDERPVVFIFSAQRLQMNAQQIGMTLPELFGLANRIFNENGLKGPVFVGGAGGGQLKLDYSADSGWSGFSAYNYHSGATLRFPEKRLLSHSYAELNAAYQNQWQWFIRDAAGVFVVPMTSGWDKRPWGGSQDPKHDNSIGTPTQFVAHLNAAKQLMDNFPGKTRGMGVICCWNEFGEGSFIEPTKHDGFSYLKGVKKVFGTK